MHELTEHDVPLSFSKMQNCIVRANELMAAYNDARTTLSRPLSDYADRMAKIAETANEIARSFTVNGR